jgi:hypothetical protein
MAAHPEHLSPIHASPCSEAETGRLPDFLVIGGMKCGSTTLYHHLSRHPDIFLSNPKEPQFFSRELVFERGFDWYRSLFAEAGLRICGEASTCYSRAPHFGDVAKRVYSSLPDARLVYLVRHPVDRAYSHYRHEVQARMIAGQLPVPSFEEMLEETSEIADASDYWMQIEEYRVHYPQEQIHILRLEDLLLHPGEVLGDLQYFLGVRRLPAESARPVRSNPFGDNLARNEMHSIVSAVRQSNWLGSVLDCVPAQMRAWARSRLTDPRIARQLLSRRVRETRESLAPMRPDTRRQLLARFEDSNRALGAFLGISLQDWSA